MKVAIGSDHAGFLLKERLKTLVVLPELEWEDFGVLSPEPSDYPHIARRVAEAIAEGRCKSGVLVCGTGIGTTIAANKVRGIRAAVCHDTFSARCSRSHNDANILALGERVIGSGLAADIVQVWLTTPFSGEERHVRRLKQIKEIENRKTG